MRWKGRRGSGNIEDRRGMGPALIGGGGIGAVIIALVVMFMGGDPEVVLQQAQQGAPTAPAPGEDEKADFVGVVLADTEDVWNTILPEQASRPYVEPKLVLFRGSVRSACGTASSAVGPFYCPLDQKVYIDLSFYEDLQSRFGAPGDFAQAYVVAHEVGHHIQNLLGIASEVHERKQRLRQADANDLSVRMELQADCLAGVWAHHNERMKQVLEPGDIDEALGAASAIGDDRLQKQTQGTVVPESFTHGTSAQRARWFRRGFESGSMNGCETFSARSL